MVKPNARRGKREPDAADGLVAAPRRYSPLQSGHDKYTQRYQVPDWVGAITQDFVERAVLGVVDYWLGRPRNGKRVRARGRYLATDGGVDWYTVTAAQLAGQLFTTVTRVRRAVARLERKRFLAREEHIVDGWTLAMRLRVRWEKVEKAVGKAWGGLHPPGRGHTPVD